MTMLSRRTVLAAFLAIGLFGSRRNGDGRERRDGSPALLE